MRSALVAVVFVCGFLLGTTQSRSTVLLPYPNEAEHSNLQQSLSNQARELEWQAAEQYAYENSPSTSEERNQEPAEGNTDVPWEIIVQRLGKLRVRRQSNAEREGGRTFSRSGSVGGGGDRPMLSILNPLDVLRQRLLLEMARRRSINQINENKQLMQNVGRRRRDASIEKSRPKLNTPLNKQENGSTYRSGPAINTVRSSPGLQVNPSVQPPVEQ